MANVHIVTSRVKNGFVADALSVQSMTITNNTISANTDYNCNFITVAAIGGAAFIAFAPYNVTPNAANTMARVYLPAESTMDFGARGSIHVHTLDA